MKLSSWPEIGSDGDVLLTPYVPKGITGYDDDDDDDLTIRKHQNVSSESVISCVSWIVILINGQTEVLLAENIARWLNT
jgi:hypothetical protein